MSARVLVTRPEGRSDGLVERLQGEGFTVLELPLLAFEPIETELPPARPDDLLVLSSTTALEQLLRRPNSWLQAQIAAVGPSTAQALREAGYAPRWVPNKATALDLAALLGDLRGRRVLYPRAEEVPPEFESALRAAGAELVSIPVYRTVCPPGAAQALRALLPVQAILLSSGSAARHLHALGQDLGDAQLVAIGPSTEKVCITLGYRVAAVASPHSAEGLAQAVSALFSRRSAGSGPS